MFKAFREAILCFWESAMGLLVDVFLFCLACSFLFWCVAVGYSVGIRGILFILGGVLLVGLCWWWCKWVCLVFLCLWE